MKKNTLTILTIILIVSIIPRIGQAQTISDMVVDPVPSMLCVVSSMYDEQSNYILVNWKIANVDPGTDPVDIYMYLKSTDNFDNYFVKIDFLSLMMGKNIMDTITAVDYKSKFLDSFDLNSYIDNGDLIVEMFPVDVSMIPNISDGKYLIYLAVVDPKTDEVLSSTVDVLMVDKPNPGPGPNGPYNDPNNNQNYPPPNDPNNQYNPNNDPNNQYNPYNDPNNNQSYQPPNDPNNQYNPNNDPNNQYNPYNDPNNNQSYQPPNDPNNQNDPNNDPNNQYNPY
ncbi:hypothetical protein, partial [Desulfobacula sp.]|uniref:hypothetical protein n=1 Tax=Desulfobacula sp. TaxID=2593537 RepID=UPI001EB26930|nr:hypothetical protein [Desulfobacula sp.]